MTARVLTLAAAPWAGLAAGPACWAINTQLNYALVQPSCDRGADIVPMIAGVLALLSLAGAVWSWIAGTRYDGAGMHNLEQDGHPRYLLAGVGVAAGVLFALVIAMQGVAGILLDPCLR